MDAALVYSAEPKRHYVGCHLKSVASLRLVSDEPERYALDFRRRRVQFLTSLINPGDERSVYDLRLIAYPDEKVRPRGHISLAVLCRVDADRRPGRAAVQHAHAGGAGIASSDARGGAGEISETVRSTEGGGRGRDHAKPSRLTRGGVDGDDEPTAVR